MAGTSHAKDFRPPWKPFRYDPEHDMRKALPEEMAHMADGFTVPIGPCMSLTARIIGRMDPYELWEVQVGTGVHDAIGTANVHVYGDTDAAQAALSEGVLMVQAGSCDLVAALDRVALMRDEAKSVPNRPVAITGAALTWHDPKRQVPIAQDLVYVAWTDSSGKKHDGDRLASYRDGRWYWAFGTDIAVADAVTIDYWMPCRKRPG